MIDLRLGDCLVEMPKIADKSIDMILCDLPYGTTACKWDTIIPLEPLWEQYKRIIKDSGAIILTATQPFASKLVGTNINWFKYDWVYGKLVGSNFATLNYQPMKEHEHILVFGKGKTTYNPIKEERKGSGKQRQSLGYDNSKATARVGEFVGGKMDATKRKNKYDKLRFPSSIQFFNNRDKDRGLHPTQKPVALFEYLIKTYINEGDLVLDNCAGSGTTGVACKNLKRNCILIEKDEEYFKIAEERIKNTQTELFSPQQERKIK